MRSDSTCIENYYQSILCIAYKDKSAFYKVWIRCISWFNAGSMIIDNNIRWFFLLVAPVEGSNPTLF